jgi:hypothetical protein
MSVCSQCWRLRASRLIHAFDRLDNSNVNCDQHCAALNADHRVAEKRLGLYSSLDEGFIESFRSGLMFEAQNGKRGF